MRRTELFKKFSVGVVIALGIFYHGNVFADVNTAVPIDSVMNRALVMTPNAEVSVKIVGKEITDTTAQFDIELVQLNGGEGVVSLNIKISDLQNTQNDPFQLEPFGDGTANNLFNQVNPPLRASSKLFQGLTPNTTYTVQFSDTTQSVGATYQKVSFKTLAAAPAPTVATVQEQKDSLSLTLSSPFIELQSGGTDPKFKATFNGSFSSTLDLRSHIQVYVGTTVNTMQFAGTISPDLVIPAGTVRNFATVVTGLTKNTVYYYKLYEVINGYDIPSTSGEFTTPASDNLTVVNFPTAIDHQRAVITTLDPGAPILTGPNTLGRYEANFTGSILTTQNARVGLELYISEPGSPQSLFSVGRMLSEKTIYTGVEERLSKKVFSLYPGTKYYYRIRETTKDYYIFGDEVKSFTTPGTAPQEFVFNPDEQDGILGNYEFPILLGEPTGSVTVVQNDGSPLVPCGKRSDVGTINENCQFIHLFGGETADGEVIPGLIPKVIDFLLVMLIPITVLMCIYTGTQMIIHRGVPAEILKYRENFKKIGIGVAVMLLAWTIIATLLRTLVSPEMAGFILLDLL
jgi:hypothetical protein